MPRESSYGLLPPVLDLSLPDVSRDEVEREGIRYQGVPRV
jgi:hypothetical protein